LTTQSPGHDDLQPSFRDPDGNASSPIASRPARPPSELTEQAFKQAVGSVPDWLECGWTHTRKHGLDKLTDEAIEAEIEAYRRGTRVPTTAGTK
jgi:hypothetical protein